MSGQLPLSDATSCFVKLTRLDDSVIAKWTKTKTTPGRRFSDHKKKNELKRKAPAKIKVVAESDSSEDPESDDNVESDSSEDYKPNIEWKPRIRTKVKTRELSEYEKMVQKNKDEKMAFLKSLKIDEIKSSFAEAVRSLKPKPVPRPKVLVLPREKISRLAKKDIDFSEEAVASRALEVAIKETSKVLPSVLPFEEIMKEDKLYKEFEENFNELDYEAAKPINHIPHFERMQFYKSKKVMRDFCKSAAVLPIREKIIVCVGDLYGRLGLWNADSDTEAYVFNAHTKAISHLKIHPDKSNVVVSSSLDGTLRCGDLETKTFYQLYDVSDETACTYFDFLSPTTFLVAQQNGKVSVLDQRVRSSKRYESEESPSYRTFNNRSQLQQNCHRNQINTVSVHPKDTNCFISAENNGAVCIWDLRRFQKPVVHLQNEMQPAISAFFSGNSGNSALITGMETISIYDTSYLEQKRTKRTIMKHQNRKDERNRFYARWLPNNDNAFVVGSLAIPRLQVYNTKCNNIFNFQDGISLRGKINLYGFHPSLPVLVALTLMGTVFIFSNSN